MTFSRIVKDEEIIFVIPNELKLGINTQWIWIIEKGIFIKEELLGVAKLIEQEVKRLRKVTSWKD